MVAYIVAAFSGRRHNLKTFDYSNLNMFDLSALSAYERKSVSSRGGRVYEMASAPTIFRSAVLSSDATKLLAFVPPDPRPIAEFCAGLGEQALCLKDDSGCEITEIAEGTLITLFYDPDAELWEIATRTAIGGDYAYFRSDYGTPPAQKRNTFRSMFIDALRRVDASPCLVNTSDDWDMLGDVLTRQRDASPPIDTADLATCPCLALLNKSCCYNFVLQHPDNHIVNCISVPRVVLINTYELDRDAKTATLFRERSAAKFPEPEIFPAGKHTYESLIEAITDTDASPWIPGAVVTDLRTGLSGRVDSPAYAALLDLRGNHPNMQYQYLCLQRAGRIGQFLVHFPQYVSLFVQFERQLAEFVAGLHAAYRDTYILKNVAEVPAQFSRLAHAIHYGVYIPSIRACPRIARRKITREAVAEFVLSLTPGRVMHALHHEGHLEGEAPTKPRRPRRRAANPVFTGSPEDRRETSARMDIC